MQCKELPAPSQHGSCSVQSQFANAYGDVPYQQSQAVNLSNQINQSTLAKLRGCLSVAVYEAPADLSALQLRQDLRVISLEHPEEPVLLDFRAQLSQMGAPPQVLQDCIP